MAARRPNLLNAAIEFGFVAVAFALGILGQALWTVAALTLAMVAYWAYSRRNQLKVIGSLHLTAMIPTGLAVVALLVLVLGGAFFLGRALSGVSA